MERRLTLADDRGAMGLVSITRLAVILAIVGVLGYDGFAIVSNNVNTENQAQDAAYAASQEWHTTPNINLAFQAAEQSVAGTGDQVLQKDFTIDTDGTVHLLIQHSAKTVVFDRIGPLKHLTVATEHGDANSVN